MLRVTLSGSLNFQFGAFTVLVVLIHLCRGQHHVIGPSQPIVATVGGDVVLPAYLHPATNALRVTVEWTRPDLSPRFVHVLRQGVKLIGNHPSYEGRTSLFTDELKSGNISLKLSRVRISDEGRYRCFIPELDKDHVVQLVVGAASSPVVQKTKNSSGLVLQCNSTGWYPEPEVFWLDGEGNLLSAGPTETVRGPDDLYTVSSRVTVEKRHSNSFTCRVQQNHINQTREAQIHVPDDFSAGPSGSSSSLPVIIGLILGIVFVLAAAVVVVWKWRQKKIRNKKQHEDEEGGNSPELKLLMGGETDGKHPTEETETVNNVDEFRGEAGQTETDEETLQQEANNVQCADSEGTELQAPVDIKTQVPEDEGGQGGPVSAGGGTGNGSDKREETKTEPTNEARDEDASHPARTDLNKKADENKTKSDNTEKPKKGNTEKSQVTEGEEEGGNSPELKLLMGGETDGKHPTEETETVNNVDEFRGEAGQTETDQETLQQEANNAQCADSEGTELQFPEEAGGQTTRETETGLDQSQEETETEAATETDSLNPVSTDLNNKDTKTVTMMEERQKDNKQQTADKKEAQSLKEKDKHVVQPKIETVKINVHRNNEATGPQNQTEAQTPQIEQNNTKGAVTDGTEPQFTVRDGQRDQILAEGETENVLEKSQDETEIKPVKAGDVPDPAGNDQNYKEDENKTTSDNAEKLQEGQTDNKQQTEEEKIKKCAADEAAAQSLTEEDKHGEQLTAGRETLRDREKENLKTNSQSVSRQRKRKATNEKEETEEQEGIKKSESVSRQKKRKATNEKEETEEQEGIKKSEIMSRQRKRKVTHEKEEPKELEMQSNQSDPVDSSTA
ncbi:uncharacterized protein AB9X84_014883 [Acanthopagrus schlegelii]